ncbi:hypothetical protein ACQP0U_12125 [Micromonospora sp. CA-269861]|uniref:hypothetical protein n=1 Tax=Micromonospora sp. CA-269861 TaxID=3239968 RepID=UPI003D94F5C3
MITTKFGRYRYLKWMKWRAERTQRLVVAPDFLADLRIFHDIGHADAGQLEAKLARLDRDPTSLPEPGLPR